MLTNGLTGTTDATATTAPNRPDCQPDPPDPATHPGAPDSESSRPTIHQRSGGPLLTRHFICTIGTSSQPQPPQLTPVRSTNGSTPTSPRQATVIATTTAAGTLAMGPVVGALAPRRAIEVAGLVVAATVASSAAAYAAHLFIDVAGDA